MQQKRLTAVHKELPDSQACSASGVSGILDMTVSLLQAAETLASSRLHQQAWTGHRLRLQQLLEIL